RTATRLQSYGAHELLVAAVRVDAQPRRPRRMPLVEPHGGPAPRTWLDRPGRWTRIEAAALGTVNHPQLRDPRPLVAQPLPGFDGRRLRDWERNERVGVEADRRVRTAR